MVSRRSEADENVQVEQEIAFASAPSTIDLNADLGEGFGSSQLLHDTALLELVSSANIACGFHAGDAQTMRDTVRAAKERGVSIGAHPSYPDIPGFGRRELGLPPAEIARHIEYQLKTMLEVCSSESAQLAYVKPHGALYNRAVWDEGAANAILDAMQRVDQSLAILCLPKSAVSRAAEQRHMRFAAEAFVDRAYNSDGTLVKRSEPDAVIHDVSAAVNRAAELFTHRIVRTREGAELRVDADSLCVHGDNPDSLRILRAVRHRLEDAGARLAPFAV
ncbi:MAG TPA: 5-oxoprolinase subunit PxpA [Gemmatimonadaceae bacterium]|nr:5-oxoprolinase subunit PxpA [Gemmatimonadaceae bacterium]